MADAEALAYKLEASRRWKRANAEHVREYAEKYRADHPDIIKAAEERRKAKKAQSNRAWRAKNRKLIRDRERARLREYYAKNRETLLAKKKEKDDAKRAARTAEELEVLRERWRIWRKNWKPQAPAWLRGKPPAVTGKAKVHVAE